MRCKEIEVTGFVVTDEAVSSSKENTESVTGVDLILRFLVSSRNFQPHTMPSSVCQEFHSLIIAFRTKNIGGVVEGL